METKKTGETETPDEKKTDETKDTKPEAEETEEESEEEGEETEESEEDSDSEDKNDEPSKEEWKKIAQEEREAREKAEKALAGDRYKKSETKRKGQEDEEGEEVDEADNEEKPLTASELNRILAKREETVEKRIMGRETQRIARELAASDDEAEAIVEIYNSHSFPEYLSHEEKVRQAFYIAHGPRLTAKLSELRRSLKSKDTTSRGGSENTHRDAPKGGEPKISAKDKSALAEDGWKWDGNRYAKKIAKGKMLVKTSLKDKPQIVSG